MGYQNNGFGAGMQEESIERRRCRRIKISSSLAYKVQSPWSLRMDLGDAAMDSIFADISEMGMGAYTDYQFPIGAVVNLKFNLLREASHGEKSRRMEVLGRVCYCVKTQDGAFRFGTLFSRISHEDRVFISRYVAATAHGPTVAAI